MQDLAVIILTYNEQRHIARALDSVARVAKQVFVVDSGSNDETVGIAKARGATVLVNPFINQAKQFQWALDNAPITASWIMRLDADEVVSKELADEILERLPTLPTDVVGINLKRRHIWMGRWVRHGGRYPLWLLRIWRQGHGRVEDRWMDEHVLVWGGRTINFRHDFSDDNLNDISYFVDKHNRYATREAIEILGSRLKLFASNDIELGGQTSRQARLKRWIKQRVYNRLPFTLSAHAYFVWRYVFQLGFLDGRSGLAYHFLQGYWYRFLVGAKVMELEQAVSGITSKGEILRELSRLTGHPLKAD